MQQVPPAVHQREFTQSSPRLAFVESGTDGELVVLLHGVGSSASTWSQLLPLLSTDHRYLMPDYRGHGASEAPQGPYLVDDFVSDLIRLLDERGAGRVTVVGFSIGAVIALAVALAHPERVNGLVLLNSIAGRTPEELERSLGRLDLIRSTPPVELAASSAERWFTEEFRANHADLVADEIAIVGSVAHQPYAAAYEVLVRTDQIDRANEVGVPTLIVTGADDTGSTPAMSHKLGERIAGSRVVIVPRLKHYMHIEDAPLIASYINDFLAETLGADPTGS